MKTKHWIRKTIGRASAFVVLLQVLHSSAATTATATATRDMMPTAPSTSSTVARILPVKFDGQPITDALVQKLAPEGFLGWDYLKDDSGIAVSGYLFVHYFDSTANQIVTVLVSDQQFQNNSSISLSGYPILLRLEESIRLEQVSNSGVQQYAITIRSFTTCLVSITADLTVGSYVEGNTVIARLSVRTSRTDLEYAVYNPSGAMLNSRSMTMIASSSGTTDCAKTEESVGNAYDALGELVAVVAATYGAGTGAAFGGGAAALTGGIGTFIAASGTTVLAPIAPELAAAAAVASGITGAALGGAATAAAAYTAVSKLWDAGKPIVKAAAFVACEAMKDGKTLTPDDINWDAIERVSPTNTDYIWNNGCPDGTYLTLVVIGYEDCGGYYPSDGSVVVETCIIWGWGCAQ